jgi:dolichyl-phosphate-mannose--protein O-mannosyl transferase
MMRPPEAKGSTREQDDPWGPRWACRGQRLALTARAVTTLPASRPPDPIAWCLALAAAFWALCQIRLMIPAAPYFDEIHYLPAARDLLLGEAVRNQEHPPLGKLLLAAAMSLVGDTALGWRSFSALAGTITLYAGMRACWHASLDRFATLAFGVLAATGFTLFVQSRIAMLDIFMAMFVALACWQFAAAWREPERGRSRLAMAGLATGAAIATKWNAVVLAPVPGLAFLAARIAARRRYLLRSRRGAPVPGVTLVEALVWLSVLPLGVYAATFVPLYLLAADELAGGLIAQHQRMIELQSSVTAAHAYQSHWTQWVLNTRGIWYLYEFTAGAQRGVLLIGNPLTMLAGLPALAWCAYAGFRGNAGAGAAALLYGASLGLWIAAAKPVQFYYHYFVPSLFLCAALAFALAALWRAGQRWLALAPLIGASALFGYFWPILSAAALSGESAFVRWTWLPGWV